MSSGDYRIIEPPLPEPRPDDDEIRSGDQVRAVHDRGPDSSQTGIVTARRRWWRRVDVRWVSGETTTIRKSSLRKIPAGRVTRRG